MSHTKSNPQRIFRVTKVVDFHSHTVHEGEVEAAEFAVRGCAEIMVAGSLDGAAAVACEDYGELGGVVGVAVP